MLSSDTHFWGGFLLRWAGGDVRTLDLCTGRTLESSGTINNSPWERFIFTSQRPLLRSEAPGNLDSFSYSVIVRRGKERILILSEAKLVVEEILAKLNSCLLAPLHQVPISVDKLVRDIISTPETYLLTVVHARIPAGGALLRTASFYGDNLGGARWFRSQLEIMNYYGCGLRKADGGPEILRIGSEGAVYCHSAAPQKLAKVQAVLTFLDKGGYLGGGGL